MFKLLLLFTHLLGTSLALGAIVATDIRLLRRLADDRVRIAPPNPYVMRLITLALVVLYVTGGAMIALGLLDDPAYLSGNPKLQAKLILIALLSINALVLHRYTFPGLARGRRVARWKIRDFMRVALPVALSNCLWMYCAFLGIARPWSHTVSFGFVLGTAVAVRADLGGRHDPADDRRARPHRCRTRLDRCAEAPVGRPRQRAQGVAHSRWP